MKFPISFGWIFMGVCAVIVFLCYLIFGLERKKKEEKQAPKPVTPMYRDQEPEDEDFEHTMVAPPACLKESQESAQKFRKQADLIAALVNDEEEMAPAPADEKDTNAEPKCNNSLEYTIVAGSIGDAKVQAEMQAAGITGMTHDRVVEPKAEDLPSEPVAVSQDSTSFGQTQATNGEVLGTLPIWDHKEATGGVLDGANVAAVSSTVNEVGDRKNQPVPFGSKICWLAVKTDATDEVINALDLQDIQTANWEKGLSAAYKNDGELFITPALGEWVLIVGRSILEKIGIYDMENDFSWLLHLSEQLGTVQYFCTQSSADYHAWAWAENGTLVRAYAYSGKAGECLWDLGDPKEDEEALILGKRALSNEDGRFVPDEAFVVALANAWSVDPSFRKGMYQPALGVTGFLD